MDAWSTVFGQRTMESICSLSKDVEKIKENQPTLRDYFAAMALQGYMANPNNHMFVPEGTDWCYKVADAMIESRGKNAKQNH